MSSTVPTSKKFNPKNAFSYSVDMNGLRELVSSIFRQSSQASYFSEFVMKLQDYIIAKTFNKALVKFSQGEKKDKEFFTTGEFQLFITHLPLHINVDDIPRPLEPLPVDVVYLGLYVQAKTDVEEMKVIFSFELKQPVRKSVSVRPKVTKPVTPPPEEEEEEEVEEDRSKSPDRTYHSSSEEEEEEVKSSWLPKIFGGGATRRSTRNRK